MSAKRPIRILVVDDDAGHRTALLALVEEWGYGGLGAEDGETAVRLCRDEPFDLILMDVRMAGMSGIDALREIKAYNPSIPILIMTAYSDVETAVSALKSGAYDYLTKPLDFEELRLTIERSLDHAVLRVENRMLRDSLAGKAGDGGFIGQSPAMRRVMEMAATVAPSDATVLITGESGTGKEVVAKLIHGASGRAGGPFVAINCAALTETLLESELFGHEKGAFTGAERRRDGRFLAADGGTIFLDEVGEMPLGMQVKLLRAIQEREVTPVGGDRAVAIDVRIIAATNRDLAREVEEGRFRQDLFYRLNVVSLHLPPLRERVEDIPALAMHFLRRFAEGNGKLVKGFSPAAMDRLLKHGWPGNVRELENTVERAVVLLMGEYVGERELPPTLAPEAGGEGAGRLALSGLTLEEVELRAVREALGAAGGNKSEAARRLGITRKTLLSKLQKLDPEV